MLNIDPDTAATDPRLLKAAVRINQNCAGVYATTIRTGAIRIGDALYLMNA
jgi:MOSC domain-containing protein YiiM